MRMGSMAASPSAATAFCMEMASRMALRILSPPGVLVRAMRSLAAFAQKLSRGLVHLEDVPFGVGDDDGLKDGLEHRVGKLELHLAAAGFGVAQVAQAHGDAIHLRRQPRRSRRGCSTRTRCSRLPLAIFFVVGELFESAEDQRRLRYSARTIEKTKPRQ